MAKRAMFSAGLLAALLGSSALAGEGPIPTGVRPLQHVFLIMMENHGYGQIINNPNAPFINRLATQANLANNYFAVAHPSLTNYLEVVGGSNFGVHSDQNPDWHNHNCMPNLLSATVSTDTPSTGPICPIAGTGTDADTPALDYTMNETTTPPLVNIDGTRSVPAAANTVGKTIGDQLVTAGKSWKSYQESLPLSGADNIAYSDGFYTDLTDFSTIKPTLNPPLSQSDVVKLYASKHNPFVYFKNVQDGANPQNSLQNTVGFEQLYADLGSGRVPNFSFIAPNQCNDQHGRGNAGAFCNYDPQSDGSQASLNPALIYRGDVAVQRLVTAIKASRAWKEGGTAIIVMWDENDYSTQPNTNQVAFIVNTSHSQGQVQDTRFYTHFSLLKTLEAAFHLPCLNHACDPDVSVMSDLFNN
jgi:hypothetical protein